MVKRIDFSRETPESRRIYVNQWDYGLVLHITGIQAKEAHFAVEGSLDNALVVPLAEEGGILSANVPDRFLTQEREIYAYLYEETGKDAGGLLNVGEYNGTDAGEFGELEEGKDINPEII